MFSDSDADALGELDTDTIQAVVDAGFRLNGIKSDELEDAVKN
jgi:hypothetical protein